MMHMTQAHILFADRTVVFVGPGSSLPQCVAVNTVRCVVLF